MLTEKKVLIILHQERSTPGRIGLLLQSRGLRLDIRRPALGDQLPNTLEKPYWCYHVWWTNEC